MLRWFRALAVVGLVGGTAVAATSPAPQLCALDFGACVSAMGSYTNGVFHYKGDASNASVTARSTTQSLALWMANQTPSTIRSGVGAPTSAVGIDGDYYYDTAALVIYGPRVAGVWPSTGTAIIGPQGVQGPQGSPGTNGLNAAGALTPGVGVKINSSVIAIDHVKVPLIYVGSFTGDGTTTTFQLAHGLGTAAVIADIRDSTGQRWIVGNSATTTTLTVQWDVPPVSGAVFIVTIMG